jgi:hypothetical protein
MKTRASATPAPSNSPSVYGRSGSGSADPSPLKAVNRQGGCHRSTGVTIIVDGGTPRTVAHATGNIANTKPLAIGGKAVCNGTTIQCDYFVGLLDRAVVQRL